MIVVNFSDIEINFGGYPLFNKINYQINHGEKIALIGRNGSGKTTLLKLLNRELESDRGQIAFGQGIKISYLSQAVPSGTDSTVFSFVLDGIGETGELLKKYNDINKKLSKTETSSLLNELDRLNNLIEINKGWEIERRVIDILKTFNLDGNVKFSDLSAGKKRVVLLTKAIISEPDLLLLDEPTNHLDIDKIIWLENFIKNYKGTVLFVTHDRTLIENTATRIIELDRGELYSWNCSYIEYLERKKNSLAVEENSKKQFLKKLSNEEIWIRQGIKARRTRNEGRVKKLKLMREERRKMRAELKNADFKIQNAKISGKIVIKVKKINFCYGENNIIKNFSTTICRGDRIGIIGENGCGKTTLLNILLKKKKTDSGIVELGTNLKIHYFDQLKGSLDEDKTIIENVGDGNDLLEINGKTKHIIGYLQDFLFSPERVRSKVSILSGGEKTRVLLAKLFTHPSNFLVMDEPTNDLDIETLELLEELLLDYPGTLLIVSHDRSFLNNVATSVFVFREGGEIEEFIGGYSDIDSAKFKKKEKQKDDGQKKNTSKSYKAKKDQIRKLSYNEQKELDELPLFIEKLEEKKEKIIDEMSDPEFFKQSGELIANKNRELEKLESDLEDKYLKWETLEEMNREYEAFRSQKKV